MNTAWFIPALLCYALAAACFIAGRIPAEPPWSKLGLPLLIAGILLHVLAMVMMGLQAGNIPVSNFAQSLSFLALLTAAIGLILIVRLGISVVGAFVAPAALVILAIAAAMMKRGRVVLPESLRSAWLPVHVTLAFLGYALFVLAACVSIVYLAHERRLKKKRPGSAAHLQPGASLEKLDRLNYRLLGWGFVMLSFAILSGAIWADATWGHFWSWEPQESWSLCIWILYAALLESRLTAGWRGRRVAALTLVVFIVLVGSFVSVSLVHPGKHGGSFG